MQIEEAQFEGGRFPFLADRFLHLRLDLLDDFFDPRGMNAAVRDEPLDGLARDFAPERVEAREDDGSGRVVHDQFHAGGGLEGTDVPTLPADDAAFQVVAWKIDDRNRGFNGVLRGAALDGVGDDLLRLDGRGFPRLGLETLDEVGGVAPGVPLDFLQQQLARFVSAQPRHALELALSIGRELFGPRHVRGGLLLEIGNGFFPPPQLLVEAFGRRQPIGERAGLVRERLLQCGDFLAAGARLAIGFRGEQVGFLASLERGLFPKRLGIALRLAKQVLAVLFRLFEEAFDGGPRLFECLFRFPPAGGAEPCGEVGGRESGHDEQGKDEHHADAGS
jgi:hypothetical protein